MKIREILEARYATPKPDIIDVHRVALLYKKFANPRVNDYELWEKGKPAIDQKGTIGEGAARLEFTFQNKSKDESLAWVRGFVGSYSLPYTEIRAEDPAGVNVEDNDNLYTRITLIYKEFDYNDANLGEARYAHVPSDASVLQVYKLYKKHDTAGLRPSPTIKSRLRRDVNGNIFTQLAFWFTDLNEKDAVRWTKSYMKEHRLPYTKMDSRDAYVQDYVNGQVRFSYRIPTPGLQESK